MRSFSTSVCQFNPQSTIKQKTDWIQSPACLMSKLCMRIRSHEKSLIWLAIVNRINVSSVDHFNCHGLAITTFLGAFLTLECCIRVALYRAITQEVFVWLMYKMVSVFFQFFDVLWHWSILCISSWSKMWYWYFQLWWKIT